MESVAKTDEMTVEKVYQLMLDGVELIEERGDPIFEWRRDNWSVFEKYQKKRDIIQYEHDWYIWKKCKRKMNGIKG